MECGSSALEVTELHCSSPDTLGCRMCRHAGHTASKENTALREGSLDWLDELQHMQQASHHSADSRPNADPSSSGRSFRCV
eukprot:5458937-Amphidinium_carterae.1